MHSPGPVCAQWSSRRAVARPALRCALHQCGAMSGTRAAPFNETDVTRISNARPCYAESEASRVCMETSDYVHAKCTTQFQAYKGGPPLGVLLSVARSAGMLRKLNVHHLRRLQDCALQAEAEGAK